jgi:hypothetical protein
MIKEYTSEAGYVLPSVLFISVVITALSYIVLSILSAYNVQSIHYINKTKLDLACISAMQHILASHDTIPPGSHTIYIDSIRTNIHIKRRGLYYNAQVLAKNHIDSSRVEYTIGRRPSGIYTNAFIMSHPNPRVSVAGQTSINGDIAMVRHDIQVGHLYGVPSQEEYFLRGDINVTGDIPRFIINNAVFDSVFSFKPVLTIPDTIIYGNLGNGDINQIHVTGHIGTIHVHGDLILNTVPRGERNPMYREYYAEGRILFTEKTHYDYPALLFSRKEIEIQSNSSVKNAILISDSTIHVHKHSYLRGVQLIARSGIVIDEAILEYPSDIVNYDNKPREHPQSIAITNSIVNGSVLLVSAHPDTMRPGGSITIDEYSEVQGIVYSSEGVEIAGSIYGCVYTHTTQYYREPTMYINWLVGMRINRRALDSHYTLPSAIAEAGLYIILRERWLY